MNKLNLLLHKIKYIKPTTKKRKKSNRTRINKINKIKMLYSIFIITIFFGAAIGAILANIMQNDQFIEISSYLSKFINTIKTENINNNNIIIDSIIKHSRATIIIWFMGFIPYGIFITETILFSKGLACGFTTALLIRQFGFRGILFAMASYFPQNILLIPMYIALSFYSINILQKRKKFIANKQILTEYIFTFITCFIITIFASLIESYISPYLMQQTTQYFN